MVLFLERETMAAGQQKATPARSDQSPGMCDISIVSLALVLHAGERIQVFCGLQSVATKSGV